MPSPKQTLNVAMVGSGSIAKAHSNAFRQVAHFFDVPYDLRLKVICGRNQARLDSAAAHWGWEEVSTDWQAVVARPDIDVVDIAAPNILHAPIAIAAARGRENGVVREAAGHFAAGSRKHGRCGA